MLIVTIATAISILTTTLRKSRGIRSRVGLVVRVVIRVTFKVSLGAPVLLLP